MKHASMTKLVAAALASEDDELVSDGEYAKQVWLRRPFVLLSSFLLMRWLHNACCFRC